MKIKIKIKNQDLNKVEANLNWFKNNKVIGKTLNNKKPDNQVNINLKITNKQIMALKLRNKVKNKIRLHKPNNRSKNRDNRIKNRKNNHKNNLNKKMNEFNYLLFLRIIKDYCN